MPLVSVVFPLPRSPESRISIGGFSRAANSLPHAVVSSAEWVMNSSATSANLLKQFEACVGQRPRNVAGKDARWIGVFDQRVRRAAVQPSAQRENAQPILGAELSSQRRQDSGKHVARAALRQSGIASRVDKNLPIGRSENCVKALQKQICVPAFGRFSGDTHAIFLYFGVGY